MKDHFRHYFKRMDIIRNAYLAGTSVLMNKPIEIDFNTVIGDRIKEKFQSISMEIAYQTRKLSKSIGDNFFWLWTNENISSLFEVGKGFCSLDSLTFDIIKEDILQGDPHICGKFKVLEDKWYVVKDSSLPPQQIYCGMDSLYQGEFKSGVFRFELKNFVF